MEKLTKEERARIKRKCHIRSELANFRLKKEAQDELDKIGEPDDVLQDAFWRASQADCYALEDWKADFYADDADYLPEEDNYMARIANALEVIAMTMAGTRDPEKAIERIVAEKRIAEFKERPLSEIEQELRRNELQGVKGSRYTEEELQALIKELKNEEQS